MRCIAALACSLPALAFVPAAAAKGPVTTVTMLVCGLGRCLGTRERAAVSGLLHGVSPERAVSPPPVGPYYEIRGDRSSHVTYGYFVRGWRGVSLVYSPDTGVPWRRSSSSLSRELDRLASRLRPFPAPRPYRLAVEDRLIRRPQTFLALLGPLPRTERPRFSLAFKWVRFAWERSNPWSDEAMRYLPRQRALLRAGEWVRVPQSLACRLSGGP